MNGNLNGIYEAFLARCIQGTRNEREVFRELSESTTQLEILKKRGRALGLQPGWDFVGDENPIKAYLTGQRELEKEEDAYSVLPSFRHHVRHCEEVVEEAEAAARAAERRRLENEHEKARRALAEETRRLKEEEEKARRAEKWGVASDLLKGPIITVVVWILALWCMSALEWRPGGFLLVLAFPLILFRLVFRILKAIHEWWWSDRDDGIILFVCALLMSGFLLVRVWRLMKYLQASGYHCGIYF